MQHFSVGFKGVLTLDLLPPRCICCLAPNIFAEIRCSWVHPVLLAIGWYVDLNDCKIPKCTWCVALCVSSDENCVRNWDTLLLRSLIEVAPVQGSSPVHAKEKGDGRMTVSIGGIDGWEVAHTGDCWAGGLISATRCSWCVLWFLREMILG